MFVLTKRTAPSDKGDVQHAIHGFTNDVSVARAWFRSTRVTDVVEIDCVPSEAGGKSWIGQRSYEFISDSRIPSWRERQLDDEKRIKASVEAGLKTIAKVQDFIERNVPPKST